MPLKLPADQDFEVIPWLGTPGGGATHPAFVWQYLAFDPWGHISSGSFPTGVGTGYLSSYMPQGLQGASCSDLLSSATGDTSMRCFGSVWTPTVETVARVSWVRTTNNASTGASVLGGFRGGAIFQRMGGSYGTVQGAGTPASENAEYVDCYALWVRPLSTAPDADLWFHLFGITHSSASGSSGTLRELAVHKLTGGMALVDSSAAFEASLQAETVSGDVELRARVTVITVGGAKIAATLFSTTSLGGTVTLGTDVTATSGGVLTDAHTDKITSGNGVGWGMYVSRTDTVDGTSCDIVEGIANFRVSNASTGAVAFEDDFSRVGIGPDAAAASLSVFRRVTDKHGNAGSWINSAWSYGATAATDNTAEDVDPLLGQTESGTTAYDGTDFLSVVTSQTSPTVSEPLNREFWSTRPADYDYSQNRTLEIKPFDHQVSEAAWTAALDRYGIAFRGTVTSGSLATAFVAFLEPIFTESGGSLSQTSLTARLAVRIDASISDTPTYQVLWSKTVTGVDLADGSWHELGYEMHVVESADNVNAPVVHKVTIDGSAVVFDTAGAYAAGTTALSDGRVINAGNFGPGELSFIEGFFLESSVPKTDVSGNLLLGPAPVRRWRQETLSLLDTTIPPEQMASVAWAASDEVNLVKSGNLSTVCDAAHPVQMKVTAAKPVESQGEQGHRYFRARATRDRYVLSFTTGPLDATGRDALLAFWSARGRVTPFDFDLTHDRSFVVNFLEAPVFTKVNGKHWTARVSLLERLS